MEIREVIQRQILISWLSSSIAEHISLEFGPCGSSMDPALSRTMSISFEDRNDRKGARLLGFSIPEPMTLDSRREK